MSSIIGLIPARGGSKSIPGKNLVSLGGRPLLAYTADAALDAKSLGRVMLSTDDERIAEAGRAMGLEVPFLRPAELSGDAAPMLPVIAHTLDWCARNGPAPDCVVLLQPTSPLRRAEDIDEALRLMRERQAETIVSVTTVPHRFTLNSLMSRMDDGALRPLQDAPMVLRRQEKAALFARNGPAILAIRSDVIARGTLYGDPTVGYEMDAASSLDIDDAEDLWLAEQYLKRRRDAAYR